MPKRKIINEICETNKINKTTSIYKALIQNVNIDEIAYFNGMPYDTQIKIIDDLTILKLMSEINTPYRIQLLNKNISLKFKILVFLLFLLYPFIIYFLEEVIYSSFDAIYLYMFPIYNIENID